MTNLSSSACVFIACQTELDYPAGVPNISGIVDHPYNKHIYSVLE